MNKPASGKRVLIVDDNEYVIYFMSRFLEEEGYGVMIARNGWAALDYIKKNSFEVILLDVRMPVMDGIDTLEKIRMMNIPSVVIIVTGDRDESKLNRITMHGVFDIIYKPYSIDDLRKTMKRADFEYRRRVNIGFGKKNTSDR